MYRALSLIVIACFISISTSAVLAQAPVNDNFANRTILAGTLPLTRAATNVSSTAEAGEPAHAAGFGGNTATSSIWYRWTATFNGFVLFSTSGVTFDIVVAAYTGTAVDNVVELAGGDRLFNGDEDVLIKVQTGIEYAFVVDGFDATQTGAFNVELTRLTAPSNDDFANAIVLPTEFGAADTSGLNIETSAEANEPNHAGGEGNIASNSVWYRWTAPGDALVGANVGSDFDSVVAVYTGDALTNLVEVASADLYTDQAPERAVFDAVGGTSYYIAVDGVPGDADEGRFSLELYIVPPNDDIALATNLGSGGLPINRAETNANASSEFVFGEPDAALTISGNFSTNTVWYFWEAAVADQITVSVGDVSWDPIIGIYSGTTFATMTSVAEVDDGADGAGESVTFAAQAGTVYAIVVDAWSNTGGLAPDGSFSLSLTGTIVAGDDPYDEWIAGFPSLTGANAEPDGNPAGDGVSNLMKLVLGLNPLLRLAEDPNKGNYPVMTTFNNNPAFEYIIEPDSLGTGANAILHGGQIGDDLSGWTDIGSLNIGGNTWVVEIQTAGAEERFARLKVSEAAGN